MCAENIVVVVEVVGSSKRNNSFQDEQIFLAVLTVLASVLQYFQYFDFWNALKNKSCYVPNIILSRKR